MILCSITDIFSGERGKIDSFSTCTLCASGEKKNFFFLVELLWIPPRNSLLDLLTKVKFLLACEDGGLLMSRHAKK